MIRKIPSKPWPLACDRIFTTCGVPWRLGIVAVQNDVSVKIDWLVSFQLEVVMKSVKNHSAERRHAPRRQPAIGTVCQFSSKSKVGRLGLVWNISTTGVSILSSKTCPPGVNLEGDLQTLDSQSILPIQFEVAHVKELGTGDFVLAGPFPKALPASKIKPFIKPSSRRTASRKSARSTRSKANQSS